MATITARRGYHILNWTDAETGKRRHSSLGKVGTIPKRDLDDLLRIKEYELSTGARLLNVHRRPAPRFEDFVRDYKLWHQGEYPDSTYRVQQIIDDHLVPHFGITALNLITVKQAEDYKTKRRFLVKASSIVKEMRVLNAVLNRAVALKVITENPIAIVEAPQVLDSAPHRWYSKAELASIYAVGSEYSAYWKLFANTGLRRGEGMILRTMWILPKSVRILSTGEDRTKDGEWRDVPITDGAREALDIIKPEGIYVMPRIAKESLSRAFARDADRAGLDGSLKTLRHTFICHMLLAGVPVRTVQLYAGHASITTTEIYAYQVLRQDPLKARRLSL